MNTPLITEDPKVAREKLAAVRRQLHRRADTEYAAIAQGYEQLAQGRPLLNLRDCFLQCPADAQGRPRLAIARSDRKQVHVSRRGQGRVRFDTRSVWSWRNPDRFPELWLDIEWTGQARDGYALVPIIPADVRAKIPLGVADRDCQILWEVEQWSDRALGAQADRDPYLLRHLGGDLYVVLAEWDLTELERAVMAGRARA